MIRVAILEMIRSADWAPRSLRMRQQRIRRASVELASTMNREPTCGELARHLGMDVDDVCNALSEASRATLLSLDGLMEESEGDWRSLDLVNHSAPGPLVEVELRERSRVLAHAMDRIPPREKRVIDLYYQHHWTFREIGATLGVSEMRAYQLHGQALGRLRQKLQDDRTLFN